MILDTDVLIALEKREPRMRAWFDALAETPYVCGFAALEFLAGSENSADLRRIEKHLRVFPLLWPSQFTLDTTVKVFGGTRLSHGIGVLDMLIAATAIEHGQELATFNGRHFRGVSGLVIVQPY